jgi:hypothetical protein
MFFDASDDIGLAELLLIIGVFGVGGYVIYKYMKSATCIGSIGTVPGVTGATKGQATAAITAASKLRAGGQVIWCNSPCFDYLQPCNGIVTEVRSNWKDKLPIFNALTCQQPVNYTDVPVSCYLSSCGTKSGLNTSALGVGTAAC